MPVTNALKRLMQKTRSLSYCIALVMVVLFVYGLIRYPDLPIRECPSGYCGRQGQPHTAAEYNAFSRWQTTLFIVWPIGMLTLLLLQRGNTKGNSVAAQAATPTRFLALNDDNAGALGNAAFGQTRTSRPSCRMSVSPRRADI